MKEQLPNIFATLPISKVWNLAGGDIKGFRYGGEGYRSLGLVTTEGSYAEMPGSI